MEDPVPLIHILLTISPTILMIGGIVFLLILLVLSALISGSEIAFFSLTSHRLAEALSKNKRFGLISTLLARPKKLLATILIANNFVNIAIVILSSYVVDDAIDGMNLSPLLAGIIQVVVISFVLLLLGEVIPKIYAARNPVKLASLMSQPLYVLQWVFTPLSKVLIGISGLMGNKIKKKQRDISVDELSHILELTEKSVEDRDEHNILKGIVSFGDMSVKQSMKPRVGVFAIEKQTDFKDVIASVIEHGYSRIPVFEKSFDKISGVLYIKDLIPYIDQDEFNWLSVLRKPYFVPEHKKLDDLLSEFQERKIHLAIVVDEYGGTSGIITLEDVLEEIVGEISDEFDVDEISYSKLDESNFVFDAKTSITDFKKILGIQTDVFDEVGGEVDTIGGLVVEFAGKIPKKNEKLRFNDYVFTVEQADSRRVKQIKVSLIENVSTQ